MRTALFALIVGLSSVAGGAIAPAQAQNGFWQMYRDSDRQSAWCAEYGGANSQSMNCGFSNRAQCMASVSGVGGWCHPNWAYAQDPSQAPKKRKRTY